VLIKIQEETSKNKKKYLISKERILNFEKKKKKGLSINQTYG